MTNRHKKNENNSSTNFGLRIAKKRPMTTRKDAPNRRNILS